jgi:hypothetical protein
LLNRIAAGKVEGATVADRIRALDVLARYGLSGPQGTIDISDVRERLTATLEVVRELLPPEQARAVVDRMRPIWKTTP